MREGVLGWREAKVRILMLCESSFEQRPLADVVVEVAA